MPSPFPGMDPYIEGPNVWSDFHNNIASEIQGHLNPVIQPRYVARLIPYVSYEEVAVSRPTSIRPDVGIWQPQPPVKPMAGVTIAIAEAINGATVATEPSPVENRVLIEVPLRQMSIEILASDSMELVTAIEILSPVNKRPSHRAYQDYLQKRSDILRSTAHLIEIDFLRGGERPPLAEPVPAAPYYITLSRASSRPNVTVWPIQFQNTLPAIPIPLTVPDEDVMVDLAVALADVYERGGYATLIDYNRPPPLPQLSEEDAVWLNKCLHEQGVK
ncbi:MAG: DUF4058 family protein [Chloroflexota bacterium]